MHRFIFFILYALENQKKIRDLINSLITRIENTIILYRNNDTVTTLVNICN